MEHRVQLFSDLHRNPYFPFQEWVLSELICKWHKVRFDFESYVFYFD